MTDEQHQAELLADYQHALTRDPAAPAPQGLDPHVAALARRIAALPAGDDPAPTFIDALADRLALTSTTVLVGTPANATTGVRTSQPPRESMAAPWRRHWPKARALGWAAASITVLISVGLLLALVVPKNNGVGTAPRQSPTSSTTLAGMPVATQRVNTPPSATPTSCVGTLAPQQPATPPARPIPATPTGNEAALYIPCFFERDPGLARAERLGLVQHPNLTQAGPGGTVTIERFYADTNRIVVAYTITRATAAENDTRFPIIRPTLADQEGRIYPFTWPGGLASTGGRENGHLFSRAVISFEATPLPPDARQATFRLTFDPAEIVNNPVVLEGFGPWVVDLTMPIVPARTAAIGQTVVAPVAASYRQGEPATDVARCAACPEASAEGVAITLDRVVVTVSETRLYLRLAAPPIAREAGWEVRGITVEEPGSPTVQQGGTRRLPDGTVVVTLVNPLYEKSGEWTVSIHELWATVPSDQPNDRRGLVQVRLTGEWVYRFTLP